MNTPEREMLLKVAKKLDKAIVGIDQSSKVGIDLNLRSTLKTTADEIFTFLTESVDKSEKI